MEIPALLISTSIRPNVSMVDSMNFRHSCFVANVAGDGMQHHPRIFQLQGIKFVMAPAAGGDLCAQRNKGFDQRFSDPVAAAGDHDYFILEK
jgi:hypothetical protein